MKNLEKKEVEIFKEFDFARMLNMSGAYTWSECVQEAKKRGRIEEEKGVKVIKM